MRPSKEETLYSIVTKIDVVGQAFLCNSVPESMSAAMRYVKRNDGHLAAMPELLCGFPQPDEIWYTANSEELSGLDRDNRFRYGVNNPVVITSHYNTLHGKGLFCNNPSRIKKALRDGLNLVGAVKLTDDEWDEYVKGYVPNGYGKILTWEEFLEESVVPDYLNQESIIKVARSLNLANRTRSSSQNIDRLCNARGKVTDSQVIVYAGGIGPAQGVMDAARGEKKKRLGVYHSFNEKEFNLSEPQGRLLCFGNGDDLNGFASLNTFGNFFGIRGKGKSK